MKLAECSKADLLWIIKRMSQGYGDDWHLARALSDLQGQKDEERFSEADRLMKVSSEARKRYIKILEPYEGKRIADIPFPVLEQADAEIKQAQGADAKWNKLMGIGEATT